MPFLLLSAHNTTNFMKTFTKLFIGAALLSTAFVGCKDKEIDEVTPASKIAGNYLVKDTIFWNENDPICTGFSDETEIFAITIEEVDENTVTMTGYKHPTSTTVNVTNTSMAITDELGQAYNITASISGNTIRFAYTNGSQCHTSGRSTAIKQE